MQGIVKLILVGVLAFLAYFFYTEYFDQSGRALEGTWRSNKEASLRQAAEAGVSERRRALLGRLYGKMVFEIEDGVWKSTLDGEEFVGTYEVLKRDGDCYYLKTDDGKEPR